MNDHTVAICPTCSGSRHCSILAEEVNHNDTSDPFDPEWSITKFRILSCRGCGTRFFQTVDTSADDMVEITDDTGETGQVPRERIKYYPAFSRRARPRWSKYGWTSEQKLWDITQEMYLALDNELPVLAAIGMRTVFDTAIEILGIDPGGTFKEKLDAILALGKISQEERNLLDALIDAGSAAAHRGWKPEARHLDTMALILEGFLHRAFVLPVRASFLKPPARPDRR